MPETIAVTGAANFIAGEWTPSRSGRTYERVNPWRREEVVGGVPELERRGRRRRGRGRVGGVGPVGEAAGGEARRVPGRRRRRRRGESRRSRRT
jgi:hypothetical protein